MTESHFEKVDDISDTVLRHIQDGNDDIQQITEATTLPNYKVNYRFQKLEDLGLITVEKPDGTVERVVDGQKRVFEAPKRGRLTESGEKYLEQESQESSVTYDDLSREELVEKIHELETKVEQLEAAFDTFRNQIRNQI